MAAMPTERPVSIEGFRQHLAHAQITRRIDEVVVHHTWRPTAAEYRGIETVRGVRRYHMQVRGWSDNGYHVMVGPDASIFLCRPLDRAGAHTRGRNAHSIGVSVIANFDSEEPGEHGGVQSAVQVIAALLDRLNLGTEAIRFHREFASKTCPGTKLSLAGVRALVAEALVGMSLPSQGHPAVVLLPENERVECAARAENGVTRVDMRPLLAALGYGVHDHTADLGKIFVRAK